jgi:hypothetical protein
MAMHHSELLREKWHGKRPQDLPDFWTDRVFRQLRIRDVLLIGIAYVSARNDIYNPNLAIGTGTLPRLNGIATPESIAHFFRSTCLLADLLLPGCEPRGYFAYRKALIEEEHLVEDRHGLWRGNPLYCLTAEGAANALEHILRYGGGPHSSDAALYEYLMVMMRLGVSERPVYFVPK